MKDQFGLFYLGEKGNFLWTNSYCFLSCVFPMLVEMSVVTYAIKSPRRRRGVGFVVENGSQILVYAIISENLGCGPYA